VRCFLLLLALGCFDALSSAGHPAPVVTPPSPVASEAVGFWILLRAFSSGCTAMTGVEAVSNWVSAFREPKVTYAHRTLGAIILILGLLLAGISYLVHAYGIAATDQTREGYQSVLSQLASAVVGRNWFYYLALASALAVLALSANTSFTDFPRMCRIVAEDGFLPRSFAVGGRRLVFSIGIIYLAIAAGLLLIALYGITDRSIPLFAVSAFLTFTLSQTGMVIHCYKELRRSQENRAHNQVSLIIRCRWRRHNGPGDLNYHCHQVYRSGIITTMLPSSCVTINLSPWNI
jgi:amino acid transporter